MHLMSLVVAVVTSYPCFFLFLLSYASTMILVTIAIINLSLNLFVVIIAKQRIDDCDDNAWFMMMMMMMMMMILMIEWFVMNG